MEAQSKPRLGILGLMLEGYEPLFPGITARQHAYVEEVVSSLSDVAECVFPRVALSRAAPTSRPSWPGSTPRGWTAS